MQKKGERHRTHHPKKRVRASGAVFQTKAQRQVFSFFLAAWMLLPLLMHVPVLLAQGQKFGIYDFGPELSKDLIKGIAVDNLGFVWTATDKGLLRYDGQNSIFFKDEIPGGFAKALLLTRNGRLLALHDFGLTEVQVHPTNIHFLPLLSGKTTEEEGFLHFPKTIYEDRKGRLWIGENQSVALYDKGSLRKFRLVNDQGFGVLTRSFAFAEGDNGTLWAASFSGVLFYFDEATGTFIKKNTATLFRDATCLLPMPGNKALLGADEGLFEIELSAGQKTLIVKKLGGPSGISCAIRSAGHEAMVGTWAGGLHRFYWQNDGSYFFEKIEDLPFNDVVGLYYDDKNGIWATGHEHTALLKPTRFAPIRLGGQQPASITSLGSTGQGTLMAIFDGNQINKQEIYELENGRIVWRFGLASSVFENIPLSVLKSGEKIWIGDLSGSVYSFDKKTQSLRKLPEIQASNSSISNIAKDKQGNIWVSGNIRHGLIKITPEGQVGFYHSDGLNYATMTYPAPDGSLFAGGKSASQYLYRYDPATDRFENISLVPPGLPRGNFEVNDMAINSNDDLVLATSDGVYSLRFNQGKPREMTKLLLEKVSDREPCNALAFSPDGSLWVATTSGLIALQNGSTFLFDKTSGLPAMSFTNRGLAYDPDGNLWIGTSKGLSVFDRESAAFPPTPAPILENLLVNGQPHRVDSIVPYNAGMAFHFRSLSFPASQVVYKTKVVELDTNWAGPDKSGHLLLTGLAPGSYTLQIVAQQQKGMSWSEPTTLHFEVAKPWYQEWWVVLGMTAISFLLISLVTMLYNRRLIVQKKNLERIIQKRTDEIENQKNEIIEQQEKLLQQNEKMQFLKEEHYKKELKYRNKQLTTYTLNLIQKNQTMKDLRLEINHIIRSSSKSSYSEMRKLLNMIDSSFRKDEDWDNFKLFFEEVHAGFFENLMKHHPRLTSHDLRHCALIRLNLSIEEMATILGISADSIKTARFRLKKKMELDHNTDLLEYLLTL